MNLGIDDAQAAVVAILSDDTKTYDIERKKKAKKIIDSTESIRKILVSDKMLTVMFVMVATWLMQHVQFMQKKFAQKVMEL